MSSLLPLEISTQAHKHTRRKHTQSSALAPSATSELHLYTHLRPLDQWCLYLFQKIRNLALRRPEHFMVLDEGIGSGLNFILLV